ncbi:Gfo/Idh/MocA family oxidoreductase [Arthrobacter castelli]|uniref:Gfo/Idh/MocA family oxidoreductase n=1 Tax=Arthrobacter castelli TaxID=271431 RepID=UPI000420F6C8|nr:Gfo/Idh/MocA family oxidoreductase [Arthrobacter castelli]
MNSTSTPIRTALVGFGVSGRVFHAPAIASDPRYSLDFIVTSNEERAADAADRYPDAAIVPGREELFASADDLDLMVIATPPFAHVGLAADGISHGLHVSVDKPFVVNSDEGTELIEQAKQAGVVLTVFQNRRWDEDFLELRSMIDDGHFGKVHTFESRVDEWSETCRQAEEATAGASKNAASAGKDGDSAEASGLFFDLGTRVVEQAKELFGPVRNVTADKERHSMATVAAPSDAEPDTYVSLEHDSGVRSRLWMNRSGPRFRVLGSESTYTKWGWDGQSWALAAGVLPEEPGTSPYDEGTWGRLGRDGLVEPVVDTRDSNPDFYSMLSNCLLDDGPVPVDPAGPLEVLRIMEDIRAAD